MDFISHFKTLSHAYLIEGDRKVVLNELLSILENEHQVRLLGNPDFWSRSYGSFAIEDAREVKEFASKKKIGEGKRVFVISADSFTREASNALLKTLEEPSEGNHFFILLPSVRRVLPTIISRVRVLKHPTASSSFVISPEAFLKATAPERLQMIKEVLAQLEKEEVTRGDIKVFIEEVIRIRHIQGGALDLEKSAHIAAYAEDQSASLKMVLEYLALSL